MKILICILVCSQSAVLHADGALKQGDGRNFNHEPKVIQLLKSQAKPKGGNGSVDQSVPEDLEIPKMRWSFEGEISGMTCVKFDVPAESDDQWWDNFLCFDRSYGVQFNDSGPIPGLKCIKIDEPNDPDSWDNNFLCAPENDKWRFRWSRSGILCGLSCEKIHEPGDRGNHLDWEDNYLCIEPILPRPVGVASLAMEWSHAGPIPNKCCVQVEEPHDHLHGWNNNFLCLNRDYGVRWSHEGPIPGYNCERIQEWEHEKAREWEDNYLCTPEDLKWRFRWVNPGPNLARDCVLINEPNEHDRWNDNYLCVENLPTTPAYADALGIQFNSTAPISGKHCIHLHEPNHPHGWDNNYLCFKRDYGVRWSADGPIDGMNCTELPEEEDPHGWSNNFLCVPRNSPWWFSWLNNVRFPRHKSCIQFFEPEGRIGAWTDNWLCLEGDLGI